MKKLTSFVMLFLLLCTFSACGEKQTPPDDNTTPSEETTAAPIIEKETVTLMEKNAMSPFRLIYGKDASYEEISQAYRLQQAAADSLRASLNILDDSKKPGTKEILIGHTARPESAAALEGLSDNEYIISFDGSKLVINAGDPYGIKCAVRRFRSDFVDGQDACAPEVGLEIRQTYEIPEQVLLLRGLRRGMNVLCHDYPTALTRDASTFQMLLDSGIDHVRLPVTFPKFLDENNVFDEEKLRALDGVVDAAMKVGMPVILDLHFWDNMANSEELNPADVELFYSMWRQIAAHYQGYPVKLCYQFLNEPHDKSGKGLTDEACNEMQMNLYREIRAMDPERILFFSPTTYNKSKALEAMEIPMDDDFVAIDVHDYSPEYFTHYNILSVSPEGIYYPYTEKIFGEFRDALDIALAYRERTGIPMILGEFSASRYLPEEDVTAFLSDVTTYMAQHDLAWTYWELDDYWAAYDKTTGQWIDFRYDSLLGKYTKFVH